MRWPTSGLLAASAAVLACGPATTPPRTAALLPVRPPAAVVLAPAPWPDVASDARAEKSGTQDAVVVVAVERRATLPDVPGVRRSGEDWRRFFPTVLGVPAERVTALFDGAATRSAISSSVRAAAARVAPGGRLWFVAIGHAEVDEMDIASAAHRSDVQVVSVLDLARGATDPARSARSAIRPGALAPITFSIGGAAPLPGASRPALSYLLMGALRGWGDQDHDGRVTAAEAVAYLDITLRLLTPRGLPRPTVSASTDLVCSELTTLSVAREPAPNLLGIAPRVPPGPHANPERLAAALEAVRAADTQLAVARASASLKTLAARSGPRFVGEGAARRIEVVALPPEVEATRRVRLEQAARLGGPTVAEAAPLLVEAGRLSFAYGRLDESKQVLTGVLEARCGADAAGHQAWESLLSLANWSEKREDALRLVSMDCAYDEASASAIDALLRPIRSPDGPNERARQLYSRAEQEENDATLSRCTWSAVAETYRASWWNDPEPFSQVEPAINGAYAYRKLGRVDDAAALYRAYVRKQARAKAGERDSDAMARRAYAFSACSSYLAIASMEPRHFPGYFATCRNVDCTGIDRATCAEIVADAAVPRHGSASEPERARRLTLAAHDRRELAGWERSETARAARLREASEGYAAAEAAWAAIVDLGDATPDPAEAARGLAEAAVRRLVVDLEAGVEATEKSVENARKLARRARSVSTDERRVEPARLLVELADGLLAREQRAFATSQGRRGVAPRSEVWLEGERDQRRVVRDELPTAVAAAIAARDEYLASVPATLDTGEVRYRMAYEAGRLHFLYGHFAEARQRLELPYTMACGLSPVADEAWVLLLSMASLEPDVTRGRALAADAAICVSDVEARIRADRMRKPVLGIPFVLEARRQLEASEALPHGPQRRALRREAAASFRQFVLESPARNEAPEAAWLAAELYAELEQNARALEMYRLFVDRFGGETRVRVAQLERAYAALAMLQAKEGDYRAEAQVLFEQSQQKRLPAQVRAAAARKARELRADRDGRGRL